LNANSLIQWKTHTSEESKRGKLEKFVIADADDLSETNFACMTHYYDWNQTTLDFKYDKDLRTLTI